MKLVFFSLLILFYSSFFSQKCKKMPVELKEFSGCTPVEYILTFEDNFDGPRLDETKWTANEKVTRDYEYYAQKAWHTKENITLGDGTVKISALEPETDVVGTWVTDWSTNPYTTKTDTFNYTTGEFVSKQQFLYGKYEARCKIPEGKGLWPAFWTFGGPIWNEIDIFELYGDNMKRFTCNLHRDYDGDGGSENCNFSTKVKIPFSEWHVFAVVFEPTKLTWLIDGEEVRVFHRYVVKRNKPITCENFKPGIVVENQPFVNKPMNVIFNLAIQSNKNGPNKKTKFPAVFEIDYFRFYERREVRNSSQIKVKKEIAPLQTLLEMEYQRIDFINQL